MSNFNRGSKWQKWDLHIHSPYTYMNNYSCSDEDFINELIKKEISCIGLTNYFNFKEEEYLLKEKIENKKIKVFLNLELRLDYQNKEDDCLDLHVIFSDNILKQEIEKFLQNLSANVSGKKKKLMDFQSKEDFENAVVNFDELIECLNDESLSLKEKYLIGFLSRGKGNARSSSNYEKITRRTDFLIHSSDNDKNILEDTKFWLTYNKPVIQSSDAHDLNKIGSKFTWIKSDTTFNGLKQILFEPSRVFIGESKPPEPIYKLESVNLKFDENSKWDKDDFCFSKEREPIFFSPYFNCIIGGRGSGKSTLVNLIAHQSGHQEKIKTFFKDLNINNNIILNPSYLDNIEFIAQSDVDRFAKDTSEFTNAIFTRLNKKSNDALVNKENEITNLLTNIDKQITNLQNKVTLQKRLCDLKNILKKDKKLIKTFQDSEYKIAKKNLENVTKRLEILEKSRLRYKTLYESIEKITFNHKVESDSINKYDIFYNNLIDKIQTLHNETKNLDYTEAKKEIENLAQDKEKYSTQIKTYLISKGVTDDSLNDISNAHENLEKVKSEIKTTIQDLRNIIKEIAEFNFTELESNNSEFSTLINSEIEKINSEFKNIQEKNPEDVKLITVNFNINQDIIHDSISELVKILDIESQISGIRSSFYDYLVRGTDMSIIDSKEHKDFFEDFKNNPKISTTTSTYKIIEEVLNNELNFNIYKLLLKKSQYDVKNNKILEVLYDNKTLDNSSYGQRCTTALIILISLGNNPIIIDEPEAHLDSSLIANYLVELIKRMKNQRQIIFATHNANFVLNGDAELIIKLKNIDNFSTFSSFTIEDVNYRNELLQLEGGIEAFKKREKKYGKMKD
jgi:energy-coupling factor transporter ATP-binding protein EcfA2